jgi:molybdopterin-guanine dinucleotide biosynthesis protein A
MSLYSHAVIFAGGKSSRMGKDKALLPFGEESSLTEYQYKKLTKLFHRVSISTKEDKFDFDCPLILDTKKESSPLVGILSIFESLSNVEEIFILSVDAPFVNENIIKKIMKEKSKLKMKDAVYDVIVAESPNGMEPLCALYNKSILPLAQKHYMQGNHKLKDLLQEAHTKTVCFFEIKPFTNLNHPQEYEEAFKSNLS